MDEIKAGWEITSGLAFSEPKMAAKMADTYNVDPYYIITFVIDAV